MTITPIAAKRSKRHTAHPHDILVVDTYVERYGYPEFASDQIIPLGTVHQSLRGEVVRFAWVTDMAFTEMRLDEDIALHHSASAVMPARAFRHRKRPSLLDRLIDKLLRGDR